MPTGVVNPRAGAVREPREPRRLNPDPATAFLLRMLLRQALGPLVSLLALAAQVPVAAPFVVRVQKDDGSWPVVQFGGKPESGLRVHALLLLCCLGEGSTTRQGPARRATAAGIQWLLAQQDKVGRFQLRPDPDWLLDHAMATYAVAEELRLDGRAKPVSAESVQRAVATLAVHLARARPAPSCELHLWGEMLVRSMRCTAGALHDDAKMAASLRSAADELATKVLALPPVQASTAREQAAAVLLAELRRAGGAADDRLPATWPEDPMQDPLATWYLTITAWLRGGKAWDQASRALGPKAVRTMVQAAPRDGGEDLRGSWAASGTFGEHHGSLGTTAGAILLLELYYRYSCLEVCSGS